MMKRLICFIILLLFSLGMFACGEKSVNDAAPSSDWVPAPEKYRIVTLGGAEIDERSEPTEKEYEELDRFYKDGCKKFPEYFSVPRECFEETVYYYKDSSEVRYDFRLFIGGVSVHPSTEVTVSPDDPEGKWNDPRMLNEFYPFLPIGFTEEQMSVIRNMLTEKIGFYIDEHRLDRGDLSPENLHLYWEVKDDKLCANAEQIANTRPNTTEKYGCESHAHIFCKVVIDEKDGVMTFTTTDVKGN